MKYLSVCSGIEAATVAWHQLGWTPVAFSEIEKFPSQVLAHHYPNVPNLGDMTKFKEWDIGAIDILVGGTPCQSCCLVWRMRQVVPHSSAASFQALPSALPQSDRPHPRSCQATVAASIPLHTDRYFISPPYTLPLKSFLTASPLL